MIPEIKIAPVHSLELEGIGKEIKYTPYTIAHEKIILTALESDNLNDLIINYIAVMKDVIEDDIDIENLPLVDFIKIVVFLRTKSTDEILNLQRKKCKKCEKPYQFKLDIEKGLKYINKNKIKDIVKINKDLEFEIKPTKFIYLKSISKINDELDIKLNTAANSIEKIIYNKNIIINDNPQEIIDKVLINLSKQDLDKLINKINSLISIKLDIKSKCPYCKNTEVDTVTDFLKFIN